MDKGRPTGGWTIGRNLGLIAGVIGMAGFGFWGLCGTALSVVMPPDAYAVAGIVGGFVLCILCILLVRAMIRRATQRPEDGT